MWDEEFGGLGGSYSQYRAQNTLLSESYRVQKHEEVHGGVNSAWEVTPKSWEFARNQAVFIR